MTNIDTTRNRFLALAKQWRDETCLLSDSNKIFQHPAYQEIIGMGFCVVPFIIEDLKTEPDHWYEALFKITGVDPTQLEDAGDIVKLSKSWIEWYNQLTIII